MLGRRTLRAQLALNVVATTALALIVVSVALGVFDYIGARRETLRYTRLLAETIGHASALAMESDDPEEAAELLRRTLNEEPQIERAVLFGPYGLLLAHYGDSTGEAPKAPQDSGHRFAAGRLELYHIIMRDGEPGGSVYLRSSTGAIGARLRSQALITLIVMALATLLAWAGASLLTRRIVRRVDALARGSEAISEGDLRTNVQVGGADEIAALGAAFQQMAVGLRDLVGRAREGVTAVRGAAESVGRASQEIQQQTAREVDAVEDTAVSAQQISDSIENVNDNVESLSETASSTAVATVEMVASIQSVAGHVDELFEAIDGVGANLSEMSAAVREIARNSDTLTEAVRASGESIDHLGTFVSSVETDAQRSLALAGETSEGAEKGAGAVRATVEAMEGIARVFRGLEETISRLATRSQAVDEVIQVIDGIVTQTNLLALNAAIISAQAGEHGRSFSVVAHEIGVLAENTKLSTRKITDLTEELQRGVDEATEAMAESTSRVKRGVALSTEAAAVLEQIGGSAREASRMASDTASATAEQRRGVDRVREALEEVRDFALQLQRGIREQEIASSGITKRVERMRELGENVSAATKEQQEQSGYIAKAADVTATRAKEILEAMQEQGDRRERIVRAIDVLREAARSNALDAREMGSIVEQLTDHSQLLANQIEHFQI